MARSQVPEELFRHYLGRFARIDISPVAGHWERWRVHGVTPLPVLPLSIPPFLPSCTLLDKRGAMS